MIENYAEYEGNKIKFRVPEKWEDVSFKDFVMFFKNQKDIDYVLSVITGLPLDFICNPIYSEFSGKLLKCISDLGGMPNLKKPPKGLWRYKDQSVNIKLDNFQWTVSLGQQVDAMHYIQSVTKKDEEGNNIPLTDEETMSIFPNVCAIFMQPYLIGKKRDEYDSTRWKYDNIESQKLVEYFNNYNFVDLVRLGGFFLNKLQRLNKVSINYYLTRNTKMKRLTQVIKILLKPLVSFRCYILYRRAARLADQKY